MEKILIIGQAPPAKNQKVPYDSTMLYEMLSWVGVTKEKAQDMFEFEAVCDIFPGKSKNKSHLKPKIDDMTSYWTRVLYKKVTKAGKIIVLGKVAAEFINLKTIEARKIKIELIHPSRKNYSRIIAQKEAITILLKTIIEV